MYSCPLCHKSVLIEKISSGESWCANQSCALHSVRSSGPWHDTLLADANTSTYDYNEINQSTEKAYQLYAKFYSFFALLAYWIIWRGKLIQHIKFYRGILAHGSDEVVDIASGEGSLTELALFKGKLKAKKVIVFDLSKSMLTKAARRFKNKPVVLMRGDVMNMPFHPNSISVMTCFGGLNSFPDFKIALQEMLIKLKSGGRLRGSFLLMPSSPWRRRKIQAWIAKGYQTTAMGKEETRERMDSVCVMENAKVSEWTQYGDVLLFEITKT